MSEPELFVVELREDITEALIGHDGLAYVSPPQTRQQALELVAVLLGHRTKVNGEREHMWRHAIAGGQRSVTLRRIG